MSITTLKFGGSSLQGPESINKVSRLIALHAKQSRLYIVASALKGSTDALLAISRHTSEQAQAQLNVLIDKHLRTARALLDDHHTEAWQDDIAPFVSACRKILGRTKRSTFDTASILALGEKLSAALLNQVLQRDRLDSKWLCSEILIKTTGNALKASIDSESTQTAFNVLESKARPNQITLITGFCAGDNKERTTLLGRNASDYSAALVARYTRSLTLHLIGDTEGILSADPDYVPGATSISRLSWQDALLLARAGSGILHPRTVEPLIDAGISLRLDDLNQTGGTHIGGAFNQRRQSLIATWRPALQGALSKSQALPQPLSKWQKQSPEHGVVSVFLADHLDAKVCLRNLSALIANSSIPVAQSRLFNAVKVLAFSVAPEDLERFTRLVHSALHPLHRETAVAVIGANGNVGRRTLELLIAESLQQRAGNGTRLRIVALCNSQRILWCKRHESDADDLLQRLQEQVPHPHSAEHLLEELSAQCYDRLVVVDASASADIAALYERFLSRGIAIVTPNKLANSAGFERFARLKQVASNGSTPYLYETTVGAALPVIKPLLDLRRAGDRPIRIDAVLSGTIAYVLDRIQQNVPFSQAVSEAVALGYAEPDPLQDLSGEDVARKILILLRTCGIDAERAQIDLKPVQRGDANNRIPADADQHWKTLVDEARAEGKRLTYVAGYFNDRITIALQNVSPDSPFFRLRGTENAVIYHSELYRDTPLTITGPGAGIGVTSAGVFNDVINAAESLSNRSGIAALAA